MANKKDRDKRRQKVAQKRQQKRKVRAAALRRQSDVHVRYRPGIAEMGAPEGFRAVGMAQAMMEYAKPLEEYFGIEPKGMDDLNNRLNLSLMLWNHALDEERGEEGSLSKAEVVTALSASLGISKDEAEALRVRMVARRSWLFPEGVQPAERTALITFMRKETRVNIMPFAYDRLRYTNDAVPADAEDRDLIEKIETLDRLMEQEADYGTYEELLLETKEEAEILYQQWLAKKGVPAEFRDLAGCIDIYLDFIYGYMHDHVVTLKTVTLNYLAEFFEDFLIRKMCCDPQDYVDWPPAIKLFYLFLKDKGYLDDVNSLTSMINALELRFMEVLKKQFS